MYYNETYLKLDFLFSLMTDRIVCSEEILFQIQKTNEI